MNEIYRIKQKSYTDSDVIAFYMKYREKEIGPFIREVGDFIAHEKRNRGVTLETTAFVFSQLAFFQKYQSNNGETINPFGECEWWLKTYFLGKIAEEKPRILMKETGLTIKQAKAEVKSWFSEKDPYPNKIECKNLSVFYGMVNLFSRQITGKVVFTNEAIKNELSAAFSREKISFDEIPNFLVATAVVLANRSCEIVPGFKAKIGISIDKPRYFELENTLVPESGTLKYVTMIADGNMKVSVSTENKTGDGLIGVSLDLMDTEVDTEAYLDRRLLKVNEYNHIILDLDRPLAFERAARPMVFPID